MRRNPFGAYGLTVLYVLIIPLTAGADLVFTMSAPKTTLEVGETVTVSVLAEPGEEATSGNGLIGWQLDLDVDFDGVVAITTNGQANIALYDPDNELWDLFSGWDESSVNDGKSGVVRSVAGVKEDIFNSSWGVDGPRKLFEFEIIALAEGIVTYDLGDLGGSGFLGELVDGTSYLPENSNISFDAEASDHVFHVIPEPASILLLSLGAVVLRRK